MKINCLNYHYNIIIINYKNLSLFTLNLLRKNLLILLLNNEKRSIVLIPSGRQFHRSTIRLKKENLKTSVLERPFTSVPSLFLMLYLGVLKFTYAKTLKSI